MISLAEMYAFIDPLLIWPYRILPNAMAGLWMGTALLAFYCVVLGEFTMALAYLANRKHYQKLTKKNGGNA